MDEQEESCGEEGGRSHGGGRDRAEGEPQVPYVEDDDEAEPVAPSLWGSPSAMIYLRRYIEVNTV